MSSEESLSSDNDYKNNNKNKTKQRKPDMQVYVPRAKRIEDQVKQRMSSEFAVPVGPMDASGDQKFRSSPTPSPERNAAKIYWQREFRPSWEEKNEPKLKERTTPVDGGDTALSKPPIKNAVQRKGPPPPQPQSNKLPSQVIEEMMKRHKIANVAAPQVDPVSSPIVEMAALIDVTMEKSDEPLIQFKDPTPEAVKSEGDSSILSCLPATYQDFIMEEIALSAAAASQRFGAVQPAAIEGRQSQSLTSTSPTSSETPEIVQLPSCSAGRGSPCFDADDLEVKMINESFEEAQKQMQVLGSEAVKKAWNSYFTQPDTVYNPPMPPQQAAIGTPFQKPKKESLTDALPNLQESSTTSSTGTSKSRTSSESGVEPVTSSASGKSLKASTTPKPTAGDGGKLTWAGWGAPCGEPKTEAPTNSKMKPRSMKVEPEFSTSLFSPTAATASTIASGALGKTEPSMPSIPSVPSFSSTCSAPVVSPTVGQASASEPGQSPPPDNSDMDILSAAMIEKVLSEDGDDFEAVHGGSKLVQEPAPTETVQKQSASAKSSSSFGGDNNLADIWNRDENVNTLTGAIGTAAAADSWEDLFDEPSDKIIAHLMEQAKSAPSKQKTDRKEIDYFKLETKEIEFEDEEFGHVLEAHGFPASMKGDDLYLALRQLHCREFKIEWVDDSHALVVFANAMAAQEACDSSHPVIKLRPLSKASSSSKSKAKRLKEAVLPYMRRPDTSAFVARRLVEGHLGKRSEVGADQRKRERDRLQEARDQKKVAAQQRADAWEGRF